MKKKILAIIFVFVLSFVVLSVAAFASETEADAVLSGTQYEADGVTKRYTWSFDTSSNTLTFTSFMTGNYPTLDSSNDFPAYNTWRNANSETVAEIEKIVLVGFDTVQYQHKQSPLAGYPSLTTIDLGGVTKIQNSWAYNNGVFADNPNLKTIYANGGNDARDAENVINLYKLYFNNSFVYNQTPANAFAFSGCSAITKVIMPASAGKCSYISTGMFKNCTSLSEITIPSYVTSIKGNAFLNCTSLESITIPSKVATITGTAITGCTALKTLNIESATLDISELTIPDNEGLIINCATKAQRDAINAMGLTNAKPHFELPLYNLMADGSGYQYSYDGGVLEISKATSTASTVLDYDIDLDFTSDVTTVIIAEDTGITEISANMFDGWNASVIVIPSTLTTVGAKAFANMPNLTTVAYYTAYIADNTAGAGAINILSVTSLASDAFSGSSASLSPVVYLGKSVSLAGEGFVTFAQGAEVSFLVYPTSSVTTYMRENSIPFDYLTAEQSGDSTLLREDEAVGSDFKWSFDTETGKLTITPKSSTSVNFILSGDTKVWKDWKLTWTDAIESMYVMNFGKNQIYWQHHDSAFSNLPNLKHVHISSSSYRITRNKYEVNGMFEGCTSLTTVSYGSDDTYDEIIDLSGWTYSDWTMEKTFYNCKSIKKVILPTNLKKQLESNPAIAISEQMFYNCSSLESLVIPECFTAIGKNAFYGCTSLENVKILKADIGVSAVTAQSFPKSTKIHVFGEAAVASLEALGLSVVDLTSPITAKGFSIRYTDYNGLRSIFSFDETKNENYTENGYTLVEYGIIAASATDYKHWGGITLKNRFGEYVTEASAIKKLPVYKNGDFVGKTLSSSVEGERVDFAGTVVNFNANHTRDLYIGAYTVYVDENGAEYIHQICYEDSEGNKVFNLYDMTLDMLKNHEESGILSANIDEKAVWNTVLKGADTAIKEIKVGENDGITLTLVRESAGSSAYIPLVRSEKGEAVTDTVLAEAKTLISDEYTLSEVDTLALSIADMGTTAPDFEDSIIYSPNVKTPKKYPAYPTNEGDLVYGAGHPQGIAMDDEGNIYIAFTGIIAKINQKGEEVGVYKPAEELSPLAPHVGDLCWYDGKLYFSIEFSKYQLSNKRYICVLEDSVFDGGYVQDSEDAPLLYGVNVASLSEGDNKFTTADGATRSYYGGRGLSGIDVGKLPGGGYILPAGYTLKEDVKAADGTVYTAGTVLSHDVEVNDSKDYLVAVRSSSTYDTYRYDDDNQQIMVFDFDDITEENLLPITYERAVNEEPTTIDIKFNIFLYTGYYRYGTQVITYDKTTGDYLLCTYGRAVNNNEFPKNNLVAIDGSKKIYVAEVELGQSVPEDSVKYSMAQDYASNYMDDKDFDGDGIYDERLMGWHATLKCTCKLGDIDLHEAKCYGESGHMAKICGLSTSVKGDYGCVYLGNDYFYVTTADNGTALREDGTTSQTTYGAQVKIYSLSRYHGAWTFTNVTSW